MLQYQPGRVPEWSIGLVLKTSVGASSPWVRIPPLPPRWYDSRNMNLAMTLLTTFFILLFYFSYRKVLRSGERFGIIYHWAFWLGSFVWEDLMVFSIYHAIASVATLIFHDIRIFFLMIGIFWVIRSVGESIYFFLQQFHLPRHYPHELHEFMEPIRRIFGDISDQKGYIILQITHQSVAMLAASGLALLFLHWRSVPAWF